MTTARTLTTVHTNNPVRVALQCIGTGARAAAATWTVQEWAGKLAAGAGPRDYVGQLRALYAGIVKRWRYVMESGERVPESAAAVLGHVLGADYNQGPTCPSAERCDLARTKWGQRGWGDCDDVSTLVAAGVLALGMKPLLRVVTWPGGGHVSVIAETPRSEWVSIDPVGHPDQQFGWAMPARDGPVMFFDLDANQVKGPSGPFVGETKMGVLANQVGPFLQGVDGRRTYASAMPRVTMPTSANMNVGRSYMLSPRGVPRAAIEQAHVVMVRPGDSRGRRVLTLPRYHGNLFARGLISDRAPAVDQFGEAYEYLAGVDAWAPMGEWEYDAANMGSYANYLSGFGGRRRRRKRRAARKAKRRKFFKKAGKAFRKVFKFSTKMAARIVDSKIAKRTVGAILGVFGVPNDVVNSIFHAAAEMLRQDGKITSFVKMLLRGRWKKAAKIALQVAKVGTKALAKGQIPEGIPGFSGADVPAHPAPREMWGQMDADDDDRERDLHWFMDDGSGAEYPIAPVMGFRMGEPDEASDASQAVIATAPTPGAFYRVKKGDTLLGVAGKAFGLSSGSARTAKAKMIDASAYNAAFLRPSAKGFETSLFGPQIVSFSPRFAQDPDAQQAGVKGGNYPVIWIPQAGEEPPEQEEAEAAPVVPTPEPSAPPVKVPVEEPEPAAVDDGIPPVPTAPCPAGFKYKLTPAFKSGNRLVPAGWSCTPDPDYRPPAKPKPPAIEPKPPAPTPNEPERPTVKDPPTVPDPDYWDKVPKKPADLPPIKRPTQPAPCGPGMIRTWPKGQEGFGPGNCTPPPAPNQPSDSGSGIGAVGFLGIMLSLMAALT